MFLSSSPGVNGYGSVCHEPLPITNISSRFFRRRGEGCHFRFRAPANHLASTFLLPWSGDFVRATRCHPSQVTVNSNSSHPTSIVSVGYHVTVYLLVHDSDDGIIFLKILSLVHQPNFLRWVDWGALHFMSWQWWWALLVISPLPLSNFLHIFCLISGIVQLPLLDKNTWNHVIVYKLFVFRIVIWGYNCVFVSINQLIHRLKKFDFDIE